MFPNLTQKCRSARSLVIAYAQSVCMCVCACGCTRTSRCVRLSNRQSVRTISTLKHLLSDRVALPTIGDGYHLRFQIAVVSSSRKNCNNISRSILPLALSLSLSLPPSLSLSLSLSLFLSPSLSLSLSLSLSFSYARARAHTHTHTSFAKRFKRFQTRTNGGDDRAAISCATGEFHRSLNPTREIEQRPFSGHLKVSLSPRRARSA